MLPIWSGVMRAEPQALFELFRQSDSIMNDVLANAWSLKDQTILVTGASSGIGRAVAQVLAERGARLVLSGRNEARLLETLQALPDDGHLLAPYDLADLDGILAWLGGLIPRTGRLSGLAHCAGIFALQPARLSTVKTWDRILRTNLIAAAQLAAAFRPATISTRPASMVFVSSVAGLVGDRGISAYSASKGALISLTKTLALEFAAEQIRVNCVAPGQVATPMREQTQQFLSPEQSAAIEAMHPLGIGLPADVAQAIAFLLMPCSRWFTGSTLVVDGGYTAH